MCYYRRLHFVSCNHQYWIQDSVLRYCPAATPLQSHNPPLANAPPTPLQLQIPHTDNAPPTPELSPTSTHKRDSAPMFATPSKPLFGPGDPFTPPSSTSSTPARRRPQTTMTPCNMKLSHPFSTYRISSICPPCKAHQNQQQQRLERLKSGLAKVRMDVDRLAAKEDLRARGGEAEAEDEIEAEIERNEQWEARRSLGEELRMVGEGFGDLVQVNDAEEVGNDGMNSKQDPVGLTTGD